MEHFTLFPERMQERNFPAGKACMAAFEGEIPAAKPAMCGNYLDHNLGITKIECRKFVDDSICVRVTPSAGCA